MKATILCMLYLCAHVLMFPPPQALGQSGQALGRPVQATGGEEASKAADLLEREVNYLLATHDLTEHQVRHLRVAAKGVIAARKRMRATTHPYDQSVDWAEDAEIEVYRRQNTIYVGPNAANLWLLDHPLWTNAVDRLLNDEERAAIDRRRKRRRRLAADLFVSALDQRLKLSEQQYNALTVSIRAIANEDLQHIRCDRPGLLVPALRQFVRKKSNRVWDIDLRIDQLPAWNSIRREATNDLLVDVGISVIDLEGGGAGGGGLGGGAGVGFF